MKFKIWQITVIVCSIFLFIVFAKLSIPVTRQILHITSLELEAEDYLENKYKIRFKAKKVSGTNYVFC